MLYSALQFAYKSSSAHRAALFRRGQSMKKLLVIVAALFAVHAYAGGASIMVCESMTPCRVPLAYDAPSLTFDTNAAGLVAVDVNLWLSQGCSGDPDMSMSLSDEEVPDAGHWNFVIFDWAIFPDGTDYSVQWTIDGCPATDCINGTTGTSPDICEL